MPCQNGGTCISESNGYRCMCPEDTDGKSTDYEFLISICFCTSLSVSVCSYDEVKHTLMIQPKGKLFILCP